MPIAFIQHASASPKHSRLPPINHLNDACPTMSVVFRLPTVRLDVVTPLDCPLRATSLTVLPPIFLGYFPLLPMELLYVLSPAGLLDYVPVHYAACAQTNDAPLPGLLKGGNSVVCSSQKTTRACCVVGKVRRFHSSKYLAPLRSHATLLHLSPGMAWTGATLSSTFTRQNAICCVSIIP